MIARLITRLLPGLRFCRLHFHLPFSDFSVLSVSYFVGDTSKIQFVVSFVSSFQFTSFFNSLGLRFCRLRLQDSVSSLPRIFLSVSYVVGYIFIYQIPKLSILLNGGFRTSFYVSCFTNNLSISVTIYLPKTPNNNQTKLLPNFYIDHFW